MMKGSDSELGRSSTHSDSAPLNRKAKKKLRRLVYGSMIVGGALGLAGLTAQAHGNASSHGEVLGLTWNFDNFVINRESLIESNTPGAVALEASQRDMTVLERQRSRIREQGQSPSLRIAEKSKGIQLDHQLEEKLISLRLEAKQIQHRLVLTPLSRNALKHIEAGDTQAAISLIEDAESPDAVLSNYAIVQLDLYNYGAVEGMSTTTFTNEIMAITDAALKYQQDNAPKNLMARASFLHNLASAASPDFGIATPEQNKAGRNAAEEALKLRRQVGEVSSLGIALYMAGIYDYKDGNYDKAEQLLTESINELSKTSNDSNLAWSKLFLGATQLAKGNSSGQLLIDEAKQMFEKTNNQYGVNYIVTVLLR